VSVGRQFLARGAVILVAAVLALVSLLAVGAPAQAATTFAVTNPADTSDPGTLREAVTLAVAGDTIRATPGGAFPSNDQRGAGFPRILGDRVDVGAVEAPHLLAATGQGVNLWVPIGGGILLLLGVGAFVFAKLRARSHRSAPSPEATPDPD
jgi:hypothetical protein